jgi:hypothetical protein
MDHQTKKEKLFPRGGAGIRSHFRQARFNYPTMAGNGKMGSGLSYNICFQTCANRGRRLL